MPVEVFGIKEGLSQGLVSGILQDKEGFLWFSTKDGLNRYDGYQIKVFRHDNKDPFSLPDNYITEIIEDDKGRIWIGTFSKGLCVYNKRHNRFYKVQLPKEAQGVNALVQRLKYRNGILYVTRNNLILYDISQVNDIDIEHNNLQKTPILCNYNEFVYKNNSGILGDAVNFENYFWLTNPNEFWLADKDSFYHFRVRSGTTAKLIKSYSSSFLHMESSLPFYSLFSGAHSEREIIIFSKSNLVVFDFIDNQFKFEYTNDIDQELNRPMLISDNLFLCLGKKSGFLFNPKTYEINEYRDERNLLNSSKVTGNTYLRDRNEVLWIGTSGHGVYKVDHRKSRFKNFKPNHFYYFKQNNKGELLGENILMHSPVLIDIKNNLSEPLFDSKLWKTDWELIDFICDREGIYYLLFFDRTENKYKIMSFAIATNKINIKKIDYILSGEWNSLLMDRNDHLWLHYITSEAKPILKFIDKNTLQPTATYFFPAEKETRNYPFISSFLMDQNNVWWFATIQGLYSFNIATNEWHHWQHRTGDSTSISENILFDLCADPREPNHYLWLGTNGEGLNKFDLNTKTCTQFTIKDGLPNQVIYSIERDEEGNLWMGTNNGISCLHTKTNTFKNYTVDDGLPGNEFNRYSSMRLTQDKLLFSGVEGVTIFNPKEICTKGRSPSIVLTGLSILNKPFDFRSDTTIMKAPITYASSITLPPDKRMFSISFSGLEYSTPAAKKYRYYLKGFDKTWIEAGQKNEATYNNLSPGTYTFHVIGAGVDDVWNNEGSSIKIIVLPAWWQTWWFRFFVLISLLSIMYALYKYRLNQAIKLLTIRNRIAGDLHDEIGSTLSSISMSSSVIQEKLQNTTPEIKSLLALIGQNTTTMIESLSDIVWTINTKNETFENVIQRMRAFGAEILELKGITFELHVQEGCELLSLSMPQRKNLYLIFKEAINNAAKYAECKLIRVDIAYIKRKKIQLSIHDDGKGFDATKDTSERLGGNGIVNMKKRTLELHGELTINSNPQQGTSIVLQIPV